MFDSELRNSLPSIPKQPAIVIRECASGGAGVIRHRVDDVHGALVGGLEDAAARFQTWLAGYDAVQHAGRLVAGGHAKQIAEGQHARARFGRGGRRQFEMRQPRGFDF